MGIVALEASLATIGPVAFNSRLWLSLLVVPPTCALASVSTTTRRTREELALFAYGGSTWQILLRYFFRGAICALIAFSPVILQGFLTTSTIPELILPALALILAGGLFYSLPSLRRIRSSSFVEHYKS
jgi:ABC-type antimicrobial peptide transport system permease subunit